MSIPVLDHMQNTSHTPYVATTGTANTYAVSLSGVSAYTEGMALAVKINVSNTGSSTININALGARGIITSKNVNLAPSALIANSIYTLRYNGANFILQGDGSDLSVGLTAVAADILSGKTAAVNGAVVTGNYSLSFEIRTGSATGAEGSYLNTGITAKTAVIIVGSGTNRVVYYVYPTYCSKAQMYSDLTLMAVSRNASNQLQIKQDLYHNDWYAIGWECLIIEP